MLEILDLKVIKTSELPPSCARGGAPSFGRSLTIQALLTCMDNQQKIVILRPKIRFFEKSEFFENRKSKSLKNPGQSPLSCNPGVDI